MYAKNKTNMKKLKNVELLHHLISEGEDILDKAGF